MTRGMGDDCKPIAASDTGRHAVANISRVYDERLQKHDFLSSSSNERDGED